MSHVKRLAAPPTRHLERKKHKWAIRAAPGPHPFRRSVPLGAVIRDQLHLCDTLAEARRIIGSRKVLVDGRHPRDYKFPVGVMDVVSFPELKENYRMLLDTHGRLKLVRLKAGEEAWKLVRIENKTTVRGGKTQLNLHDGRNILLDSDQYKTGDVLKISIPDQKIIESYPFQPGSVALMLGGAHAGTTARIKEVEVKRNPAPNVIIMDEGFGTTKPNVFVVGKDSAAISLYQEVIE